MKKSQWVIGMILSVVCANLIACASVKPYQKVYLNDEDMILKARTIEIYETNFQAYREGVAGANGGKSGGGCGCN